MNTQGKWSRILMVCLIAAWAGKLYAQLSGDLAISFVPVPGDKPSGAAPAGVTANPDIDISPCPGIMAMWLSAPVPITPSRSATKD